MFDSYKKLVSDFGLSELASVVVPKPLVDLGLLHSEALADRQTAGAREGRVVYPLLDQGLLLVFSLAHVAALGLLEYLGGELHRFLSVDWL